MESDWTLSFRPYAPLWFTLVCVVAAVAWYAYRETVPPVPARTRGILLALRLSAIAAMAVVALGPRLVTTGLHARSPRLSVLVDRSESMSFIDALGSRRDAVVALNATPGMERLRERAETRFVSFARNATPFDDELPAFDGDATAIGDVLLGMRRRMPPPDRVVLITDGVSNTGPDPVRAASEAGLPVIAIGVGSDLPQRDVRVVGVSTPEIALAGKPATLTATVENAGAPGRTVALRAVVAGRSVARREIRLPAAGRRIDVDLELPPASPGVLTGLVEVDSVPDEILTENNKRPFSLEVLKAERRVLVLAGAPSADLAFLLRLIARRNGTRVRLWMPPHRSRRGGPAPLNPDSLADTDIVILHELPERALAARELQSLAKAVREGAGLLVVPGRSPIPETIAAILPVELSRSRLLELELSTRISTGLERHPAFADDPEFSRWALDWNSLPPLLAATVGATIRPGGSELLASDSGTIAASGRHGAGRVATFLGHTHWRWETIPAGMGSPQSPAVGFWQALSRWLATREPVSRVRLQSDQPHYRLGEPIRLFAHVFDDEHSPLSGATVRIDVDNGAMTASAGARGEGRYAAEIVGLTPGEHRAIAEARNGSGSLGTAAAEFSVSAGGLEHEETRQRRDVLERIAATTGGDYAPVASADSLLTAMQLDEILEPHERRIDIGASPWLLFFIIATLAAEWTVRRTRGLL